MDDAATVHGHELTGSGLGFRGQGLRQVQIRTLPDLQHLAAILVVAAARSLASLIAVLVMRNAERVRASNRVGDFLCKRMACQNTRIRAARAARAHRPKQSMCKQCHNSNC